MSGNSAVDGFVANRDTWATGVDAGVVVSAGGTDAGGSAGASGPAGAGGSAGALGANSLLKDIAAHGGIWAAPCPSPSLAARPTGGLVALCLADPMQVWLSGTAAPLQFSERHLIPKPAAPETHGTIMVATDGTVVVAVSAVGADGVTQSLSCYRKPAAATMFGPAIELVPAAQLPPSTDVTSGAGDKRIAIGITGGKVLVSENAGATWMPGALLAGGMVTSAPSFMFDAGDRINATGTTNTFEIHFAFMPLDGLTWRGAKRLGTRTGRNPYITVSSDGSVMAVKTDEDFYVSNEGGARFAMAPGPGGVRSHIVEIISGSTLTALVQDMADANPPGISTMVVNGTWMKAAAPPGGVKMGSVASSGRHHVLAVGGKIWAFGTAGIGLVK